MDIFTKNLNALKGCNYALYEALLKVVPNENFETFVGSDPLDINFFDKKRNVALFENNTIKSTMNKFNDFHRFTLYPYLYFFGIGNGVLYKLLFKNEHLKRLVVVEPNIEIIFIVLNLIDFSNEINSKQLILFSTNELSYENLSPIFYLNRNALIYSKLYDLHFFNDYYNSYTNEAIEVNSLFIRIIEHGVIAIGNDSKDAITGVKHHIKNIPFMLHTPSLLNLAQNLKNTQTAVIVSTGPSLHKQIHLLKEIAPYVTIFCIDASFPILSKHNIKPDIVLSLERVQESAKFYEVVEAEHFQGVIFEATSIVHERLIKAITSKGGLMQLSERPFGYTSYFELNEYGYLGIGMSAANMAYELVVHSGFKTCILIGQDLAFGEDGTSHSVGAVYGEREIDTNSEKVYLEKYGGGGVVESTQVWKLFLNFFIKDIYDTKDRIKVINATEGGARIPGAIEMSFANAIANIDKSKPKIQIILTPPTNEQIRNNLIKARKKVKEFIKYGENKKKKIEDLFLQVMKQVEILQTLNNQNKLEEFDFATLNPIFDEIEKIKNLFSTKKFVDMFNEATQAFIFHQEMELAKIATQFTASKLELQTKQLKWLLLHKDWLFSLAGCLDSVLFCAKESFSQWD